MENFVPKATTVNLDHLNQRSVQVELITLNLVRRQSMIALNVQKILIILRPARKHVILVVFLHRLMKDLKYVLALESLEPFQLLIHLAGA